MLLFHRLPEDGFQLLWRCLRWVVEVDFMVLTAKRVPTVQYESVHFGNVRSLSRERPDVHDFGCFAFVEAFKPQLRERSSLFFFRVCSITSFASSVVTYLGCIIIAVHFHSSLRSALNFVMSSTHHKPSNGITA
jgi:hypothetical protein